MHGSSLHASGPNFRMPGIITNGTLGVMMHCGLLFAPPKTLQFDKVIFNTEAHPLKRAR
jgi:hypothetical protein